MYAAVIGSYLILEELQGITLYSRRHTGAIKVFEKTGALLKLQQVIGHNDMKVSLTDESDQLERIISL
jgi:hypothetical protein